jgi:predicted enzyme related to lactoylglutathione lyase
MAVGFDLVTLDSPEPERAARFWSAALVLHETEREDVDRWIVLSDTHGVRRIGIQRGECRPGSVHLDLRCTPEEFEGELVRLEGLGARSVGRPRREPYGAIANLVDPDGTPFDLCAYADW